MNSKGRALVVWQESDSETRLVGRRYHPKQGWGELQTIASGPFYYSPPGVVLDASNDALVVWAESTLDGESTSVWARRETADGEWSEPEQLSEGPFLIDPRLALGAHGTVFATWFDADAHQVQSRLYDPESGWGDLAIPSDDGYADSGAELAVAPDGTALALWNVKNDGTVIEADGSTIGSNRYDPETGWGEAAILGQGLRTNGGGIPPQASLDENGVINAVWTAPANPALAASFARYTPEAGFSTERLQLDTMAPQLTVDESGNALVVWAPTPPNDSQSIGSHLSAASTAQMSALTIDTDGAIGTASEPQLAGNAVGDAVAVWRRVEETADHVWTNRFESGVGWGTPIVIAESESHADGYSNHLSFEVAIDPEGNALLVWIELDGESTSVWAAVLAP